MESGPKRETAPSLTDKQKKIVETGNQLISSFENVQFQQGLERMNYWLKKIDVRTDWQKAEAIPNSQEVETVLYILKSLRVLEGKESAIKRASKKLIEITQGVEEINSDKKFSEAIQIAATHLRELVASLASAEDKKASAVIQGAMTDKQVEESRERISKLNIS